MFPFLHKTLHKTSKKFLSLSTLNKVSFGRFFWVFFLLSKKGKKVNLLESSSCREMEVSRVCVFVWFFIFYICAYIYTHTHICMHKLFLYSIYISMYHFWLKIVMQDLQKVGDPFFRYKLPYKISLTENYWVKKASKDTLRHQLIHNYY